METLDTKSDGKEAPIRKSLPWIVLGLVFVGVVWQLRNQGRLWVCACGYVLAWAGDTQSSDNSQHLFDAYSFTHVLHGFLLLGLIRLLMPKLADAWQMVTALTMEGIWEIFENTAFVIHRYRTETISLGYTGDTILNSFGDIAACTLGVLLARQLGLKRSLVFVAVIEVVLIVWIQDSLLLNIVMLIYPLDAIRAWQSGH